MPSFTEREWGVMFGAYGDRYGISVAQYRRFQRSPLLRALLHSGIRKRLLAAGCEPDRIYFEAPYFRRDYIRWEITAWGIELQEVAA